VDADGKKYAYPMGTLTWTMVSGGDIASVTPQGVINSTGDGVARVRVTDSQFGLSAERLRSCCVQPQFWSWGCWALPAR
jgi:hypothetical protein